jgi:hypothetical protein
MNYEEKMQKYAAKNGMQMFKEKTPWEELPVMIGHGSSTHHPERKGGITTCDIVTWVKFYDTWFRPYGRFEGGQIKAMWELCINDNQVQALFEMLSCVSDKPKV